MNDKLNITIKIANQPPIPLTIKRDEEELIRQAESNVNRLWSAWSVRFNTSPEAILAMVAFQFAKLHAAMSAEQSKTMKALKELNADADRLLAGDNNDDQPTLGL
ncbi:MAG: cell division protein ZapA [Muribaculaceae bacterium]|nr:cell division protein ZapA [Muribaculaceae bacterium]